jgi:quercetin dioxygenase-like cupin family protein
MRLADPPKEPGRNAVKIHTADWGLEDWVNVRDGVDRKAFSGSGATIALHRLRPGHEPRPHSHPNEQIVYILSGVADFHIGDEVVRLGPGGLAVVPGGVIHHAVVVGDDDVLNLDVFTPMREEYAAPPVKAQ